MTGPVDLAARIAAKRAELDARKGVAAPEVQQPPAHVFDPDLIPDVLTPRTAEDEAMDRVIDSIDILDAYQRWCGKMSPEVRGGQRESIMVSCPKPSHPDAKPSAWINLDKQTWYCGGCSEGGDAHDMAAYHFGFPVPGYKSGATFHDLRRKMAESMGWTQQKFAGGVTVLMPPTPEPPPAPTAAAPDAEPDPVPSGPILVPQPTNPVPNPPQPGSPSPEAEPVPAQPAPILHLDPVQGIIEDEFAVEFMLFPSVPWRDILPENTFLRSYMNQTSLDDVPEEYHFWNGLIALGFALGRDVTLYDRIPIYANLFVCTLGKTGAGKSQARYHMDRLLHKAMPVDQNNPFTKGVEKVSAPGSAEVMIHHFQRPIVDPTDPKKVMGNAPVRGLIDFNELSALVGRAQRLGNTLKPTLMQFYDMETSISTSSMATGKKLAEHPFASALTTTQPRALAELLSSNDVDSGFLNRWVFAGGPYKKRTAIGGVEIDIDPCVPYLKNIVGWCGFGRKITWTEEAEHLFTAYYHEKLEPLKDSDDGGLMTRIDLTAKKLCLLLTANMRQDAVSGEVVEQVKTLMEYVITCYRLGGKEIGNSLEYQIRDQILHVIDKMHESKNTGASLRDINMYLKRKKYPQDKIVKVIDFMSKLGEIEGAASKGVGRPTVRFQRVG